jgi:RND family efflux transporter MFP subunit
MNRTLSLLWLILSVLLGCNHKPAAQEVKKAAPEPTLVTVAQAEARRVDRIVSVTGSLLPDEQITVNSEVAGRVSSIRADFGQAVRRGDVLAEIDKREYEIQLERAKAALAQALARAGLTAGQENDPPRSTPMVRQAQAQMEDAKFKYDSAAKLVKTGDISQDRFNELEKAYRARQAAYEAAMDELRTLWANIEALKAEVKLAQKRVSDATLRAPFDGTVAQKHISPGQYLKDNQPILTLVKTNPLRLRLEVPETAAGQVAVGTTLTFTTDATPGAEFRAQVRELNPSLDSRSRSLTAEARLTSSDVRLRPGMFAQIRLVLARDVPVVLVPKRAVYTIAGLSKVFAIRDGKAVELRVLPGDDIGGYVEIPGDLLKPGESLAISQLATLVQGMPVRIGGGRS